MLTYYTANRFLNEITGRQGNIFSSIYIGLSTTVPSRDGTGFTEPVGGGYSRALLGNSGQSETVAMNTAADGKVDSKSTVYFPEVTGEWGTCTYYLLFNAKTGGTLIAYGLLTSPITPKIGNVPIIRVGELEMSLE